jgi:hypothetical protein
MKEQKMTNVYTLTLIDPTLNEEIVVGIFEAEGLAEMARHEAIIKMSEQALDRGVFFRVTAYQMGKLYTGTFA